MQIALAPNAFKGSLTAQEAVAAMADGLQRSRLAAQVWRWPLADGGDGTLDVMLSAQHAQRRTITVHDALGRPVQAAYGLLGQTAIIEMARASGLAMLGDNRDALRASSDGTGQLMQDAIAQGATRILLGVGGSATVDGGAGCLAALGVGLFDAAGDPLPPGGGALDKLTHVQPNPALADVRIEVLCDVDNPPLGPRGAAPVFGPQKGASPAQVEQLAANLAHFFGTIAAQGGRDVRDLPGGGAAGALAGGLAALAGAELVPGAQIIIEILGYAQALPHCDLVITGEGALDAQTEGGKAPAVIARLAAEHGVPTIALAGSIPTPMPEDSPFAAAFSLVPGPVSLDAATQHATEWLAEAAYNLGNALAMMHSPT